jgi:hypothetical protein
VPRLMLAGLFIALSASCGGHTQPTTPTPTGNGQTPNNPPQIVTAVLTPGVGFDDVTTFTAHLDATDPDSDSLSIAWSLPLGTVVSDQPDFTFVRRRDESPLIGSPLTVTVTDGKGGRATAKVDFVAAAFNGAFDGFIGDGRQRDSHFVMVLAQSGSVVTGQIFDFQHQGLMDPAEPGHLDADGHFRLRFKLESLPDLTFVGTLLRTCNSGEPCPLPNRSYAAVGQLRGGRFDGQSFTFGVHTD